MELSSTGQSAHGSSDFYVQSIVVVHLCDHNYSYGRIGGLRHTLTFQKHTINGHRNTEKNHRSVTPKHNYP